MGPPSKENGHYIYISFAILFIFIFIAYLINSYYLFDWRTKEVWCVSFFLRYITKMLVMKRILFVLLILIASGCKPQQYTTPIKEETVVIYKDSTIYHKDTVHIELVHEAYNYYTALQDTLELETEYSIAHAYVDTSLNMLGGDISNKNVKLPVVIEYKDRIITNDTTIYKDKPIYIEVSNKKAEREAAVWKWLFMMVTAIALVLGIEIIIEKIFKK